MKTDMETRVEKIGEGKYQIQCKFMGKWKPLSEKTFKSRSKAERELAKSERNILGF